MLAKAWHISRYSVRAVIAIVINEKLSQQLSPWLDLVATCYFWRLLSVKTSQNFLPRPVIALLPPATTCIEVEMFRHRQIKWQPFSARLWFEGIDQVQARPLSFYSNFFRLQRELFRRRFHKAKNCWIMPLKCFPLSKSGGRAGTSKSPPNAPMVADTLHEFQATPELWPLFLCRQPALIGSKRCSHQKIYIFLNSDTL